MKYLDEIDEVAGLIGAVNTIDFKDMKGYNTDGIGAVKAIEEVTSIKTKMLLLQVLVEHQEQFHFTLQNTVLN